jgi:hypothetical protein
MKPISLVHHSANRDHTHPAGSLPAMQACLKAWRPRAPGQIKEPLAHALWVDATGTVVQWYASSDRSRRSSLSWPKTHSPSKTATIVRRV